MRLRRPREEALFRVPLNVTIASTEWPIGLLAIAALVGLTWAAMVLQGDPPTIGASVALVGITAVFAAPARRLPTELSEDPDPFRLVSSPALTLAETDAKPGGVLVAVRSPHSLAHLAHSLDAAGDRDIIVMESLRESRQWVSA